ncbi:indole-3-glycerol phosphate synthase TrpC [Paenibacillus pasadenensis]|uniref:indole-3-glycerol phosphate synthase TrpC n=1 Tax=Paenibacillus pasadenensis TaxID=217090 RepID=UPI00203F5BC4|nr:indole-3-glycerol phosphate synthase TrpC [Paenibacillus pasadenensis]MCM3747414.1 indole-3-glycerol phosphate synthase TrpC [Paenibacillus pasadenensis]
MFLDRIVHTKKTEVEQLGETFKLTAYEREISGMEPCRGFIRSVTTGRRRDTGLIAEVKKASPSKGLIREDFHPVELAATYEQAGADCISVLTDRQYFQGALEYLTAIHEAVSLPLLRKDFIIDYRQVYEARIIGADAVLLIAAILNRSQLKELHEIAESIGMDVLVEVHDEREMDLVLDTGIARLVGINNRNLHTFETSLETTHRLMGMVPTGVNVISESSISRPEDIEYIRQAGACGVLVGEHFMRQADPGEAVEKLLGPVTKR